LADSRAPLSEHRLRRRVQFHETDAAGLVHFSCFFRYMEEAEHALWRAAGLSIAPPGSLIGWPRQEASFDYHRALHFEDEFEIDIRIVAIEERKIRYVCELTKDAKRVARGGLTIVCVSKRPGEAMRAMPIPPEIRARLCAAPLSDDVPQPALEERS
jgi:YbgC/YbaW family acyl-CoA thioester hydrolase